MNIFTSSELASKTKGVCETVRKDGCAFITNNGKLDCMMIDLSQFDTINEAIHFYDQLIAQQALARIWKNHEADNFTEDEINAEITAVRKGRARKERM